MSVPQIPQKVKGIILVTGPINVGKTSFAFHTGYPMSQVDYFSFDAKKPVIVGAQFGFYREYLGIMAEKKELAMVEAFLNDVQARRGKGGKVLVVDGEEVMRRNFAAYTKKNKAALRDYWFGRGGIWQSYEELGFAKQFEGAFFASLQEQYELVILINHLEGVRDNDSEKDEKPLIPGKMKADVKEVLAKKASFRLWLVPTDGHMCPSAIVTKNPGFHEVGKDGMVRTMSLFPPKLSPFALPDWKEREFISLWDVIKHYEANPFSTKFPTVQPYEMLTDAEREMVSEDITDKDRQMVERLAEIARKENHERMVAQVQRIIAEMPAAPLPFIVTKVRAVLPDANVTQDAIKAIVEELKGE
jgi:hypothetical protein